MLEAIKSNSNGQFKFTNTDHSWHSLPVKNWWLPFSETKLQCRCIWGKRALNFPSHVMLQSWIKKHRGLGQVTFPRWQQNTIKFFQALGHEKMHAKQPDQTLAILNVFMPELNNEEIFQEIGISCRSRNIAFCKLIANVKFPVINTCSSITVY